MLSDRIVVEPREPGPADEGLERTTYPVRLWFGAESPPVSARAILTERGIRVAGAVPFLRAEIEVRFAFPGGDTIYRGRAERIAGGAFEIVLDDALREPDRTSSTSASAPEPTSIDPEPPTELGAPVGVIFTGTTERTADEVPVDGSDPAVPVLAPGYAWSTSPLSSFASTRVVAPASPPLAAAPVTPVEISTRAQRPARRWLGVALLGGALGVALASGAIAATGLLSPPATATVAGFGLRHRSPASGSGIGISPRPSPLDPRPSVLAPRPSVLAPRPSVLAPRPSLRTALAEPPPTPPARPARLAGPPAPGRPRATLLGDEVEVVVPLEGRLGAVHAFALAEPDGVAIRVAGARTLMPGVTRLSTGIVQRAWIRRQDGAVEVRVITPGGIPAFATELAPGELRVRVKRR